MSSSVFCKFKNQKESTRITFDGTGISVFELKREIITINRLGDGTDFDLHIYNEDTNEEYEDDTTIIPRSTSIIAKRSPAQKPGRGSAKRYVSGNAPVNALNSSRIEKSAPVSRPAVPAKSDAAGTASAMTNGMSEEEKIAAMFAASSEQWEKTQQEMANVTPVHRGGGFKKNINMANVPNHPPPQGYICYRCGEKGHWIQQCPTNNDPNYEGRPRVKRTTGIPKKFLKTVEKPVPSTDGTYDSSLRVMVNAEGEFVVAEPDKASWEQYQAKAKVGAAAQKEAERGSKELQDKGLECPLDQKLFADPHKTPCCGRTYCYDCICNALVESDFVCPGCETENVLLDDLKSDEETGEKVKKYLEEKEAKEREERRSKSPTNNAATQKPDAKKEATPPADPKNEKAKSPSPTNSTASAKSGKKRPAEDELDDSRIPKGPAAMRNQQRKQQQYQGPLMDNYNGQNYPMNGYPMMNGMPQSGFAGNFYPQNQGFFPGNPYMMQNGMGSMPGMDMSMGMGMMNPMMMPGFGGGMNNFGPNGWMGQQGFNGMGTGNMNGGYGGPQQAAQAGKPDTFPNQQRTTFSAPFPNEEDDAYFRKPVNPHRQSKIKRARPSDYREL